MEENNIIYDFGYGGADDFDRAESVVEKDEFLRTIVWKFIPNTIVHVKSSNRDKTDLDLSKLYPFICKLIQNGKVSSNCLYSLTGPINNSYLGHNLPIEYIKRYGFINCIPIGIMDREAQPPQGDDYYKSISLNDTKRCIEITNCSKNILD